MADQTQAPSTARERAERVDARLKIATAVLTFLTAVFALLTGVFVKKNDTASTKVDTSQEQVRVLASKNAELEAGSALKDSKIKQLEASLAAAPSGEPSTGGADPTGSDTPAAFHAGPLTMKPGVDVDLDATADDPQWRCNCNGGHHPDMNFRDSKVIIDSIFSMDVLSEQEPTYESCRNATGYAKGESLSITKLKGAKTLCVITSEGRYSALRIKSASNTAVAFDVTTYAKDGD